MKMKSLFRNLGLGLMVSGLAVSAQDTSKPFAVGANLFNGLTSLENITHSKTGFSVDFSYTGHLGKTDVPFRTGFAYNLFSGSEFEGVKVSMTSMQLFGDVLVKAPMDNTYFVTGLSLNKYKVKAEVSGFGSETESVKGVKFGARIGAGYNFNASWNAELILQLTELGVSSDKSVGYNPSWLQLGVKYKF